MRPIPIDNGDFDLWTRGTIFPGFIGGQYGADRWTYSKHSSVMHTVSQDVDVPPVSLVGRKLNYSLKFTCTKAINSIVPDDFVGILHKQEGFNIKPIMGQEVFLSFCVKAKKPGIYCVSIGNYAGNDRYFILEYRINYPLTWEKKIISLVMHDGESGTWDFTNGKGMGIIWTLVTGTNHIGPPGLWNSGPMTATPNQVNGCDSTDNTFWLAGVGEPIRNIQQELANAQRYYERQGGALGTSPMLAQFAGANNTVAIGVTFKVTKRKVPNMSVKGNWFKTNCTNPVANNASLEGYMFSCKALESGTVAVYPIDESCYIEAECEL
jgi:hypothetical protein